MIKKIFFMLLISYFFSVLPMPTDYGFKYEKYNRIETGLSNYSFIQYASALFRPCIVYADNFSVRKTDPAVDNREIRPHYPWKGVEYIGNYYENYAYIFPNSVIKLKDKKYVFTVYSAREDHVLFMFDKEKHGAAIMEPGAKIKFKDLKYQAFSPDSIPGKIYKMVLDSKLTYGKNLVGKSGSTWRYVDVSLEEEKVNRIYINGKVLNNPKYGGADCLVVVESAKEIFIDPVNKKYKHVSINNLGLYEGSMDIEYKDIGDNYLPRELIRRLPKDSKNK